MSCSIFQVLNGDPPWTGVPQSMCDWGAWGPPRGLGHPSSLPLASGDVVVYSRRVGL
eukprot:CAMPEP_0177221130 /NCGR_PEP_ID=MMETSP0367-20130122/37252_1 /TAXON_ID=447022 ORGANISM="Scrippsiella hangoei-like, Strain SHHI-4" /NCGR_SAMPLE_ID=MMETSP0367 /ASSEMBLY_ACC=CAM_ASM_000362 /LENGTH=56 /DNA_ID=CAMNT_0018670943 /DNA_START=166 /DNA_END=333 /DNA_ORIENTATION=+